MSFDVRDGLGILDEVFDYIAVIYCRCGFLQFVLNNRAIVSCQPMGDVLRESSAVIGCYPPEMTYYPLLLSAILREIEFISVRIEAAPQLKLSHSHRTLPTGVMWINAIWPHVVVGIYLMKEKRKKRKTTAKGEWIYICICSAINLQYTVNRWNVLLFPPMQSLEW